MLEVKEREKALMNCRMTIKICGREEK